ncbi:nucleoside 2-deoxyribosyltransferase [Motiliproteus sediminis]|uniref:nucleoside 2-deoxyribosyltransferase n=1 Tax=Motiliproteus sediminis TaxID=1468178 RepID=UPI001AEFCC4F|nr:nucleoside 2-deoxyribosyltransferase [Motiliproteus sediminis]
MREKVYLAGPLGFSEAGQLFHQRVLSDLSRLGFELLDPWALNESDELAAALAEPDLNRQRQRLAALNVQIGAVNVEAIDRCDWVLANLDGVDVDSGTAAEIGYAFARNKRVIGYRGDFRFSCDNLGSVVNLQVEYFIRSSGGTIYRRWSDLMHVLSE